MAKDKPLWILGCERCKIFLENVVPGKLVYPEKDKIHNTEYVIYEDDEGQGIVIFRDHVSAVTRESWGRMLYIARNIYGKKIRVKYDKRDTGEHFMCKVTKW